MKYINKWEYYNTQDKFELNDTTHYYNIIDYRNNRDFKIQLDFLKTTCLANIKYVWLLPSVYNKGNFTCRMGIIDKKLYNFVDMKLNKAIMKLNKIAKLVKDVQPDMWVSLIIKDDFVYYIKSNLI